MSTGSQSRRASAQSLSIEQEDEDDISLTSTVEEDHDEDAEFQVEGIRHDRPSTTRPGETEYLIEWTGYQMHQWNYEPESNIGNELRKTWEDAKREEAVGLREPFDIQIWEDAMANFDERRAERHRRREAKRKRLNMRSTRPTDLKVSEPESRTSEKPDSESSDEACEDNSVPDTSTTTPTTSTAAPRQKIFKGIPGSSTVMPASVKKVAGDVVSSKHRDGTDKVAYTKNAPAKPRIVSQPVAGKQVPELQTSTGYRGTARKVSMPSDIRTSQTNLPLGESISRGASPPTLAAVKRNTGHVARNRAIGLTARKTNSVARPVNANVFVDGKKRKQRLNLEKAMVDSSKNHRLFRNHHTINLAAKKSRDKDERAPDALNVSGKLFPISRGSEGLQISSPTSDQPTLKPGEKPSEPTTKIATVITTPASGSPSQTIDLPAKKKAKSVRFEDDDDSLFVQEPMEIDSPIDSPAPHKAKETAEGIRRASIDSHQQAMAISQNGPRKLSLADYKHYSRNTTQQTIKNLVLGQNGNRQLEVSFNGIPKEITNPGLAAFLSQDILEVSHICFAETFLAQLANFRNENLCQGAIASTKNDLALETAASYLRAMVSGLYLSHPAFNLLVYPTECDEWKADQLVAEPSSPAGVDLRYIVFSSSLDCGPFLKPLLPVATDSQDSANLSVRDSLMHSFFGITSQLHCELRPAKAAQLDVDHSFFLAFPPSKKETTKHVALWLRTADPNCKIFTSHHTGGWASFIQNAMPNSTCNCGTVIIHESAIWTIRRFPGISKLLSNSEDYKFWCWSQSIHQPPIFQSQAFPQATAGPGRTELIPLLGHGTAILVTPSFILSEPERAFELFAWFARKRRSMGRLKLVSAWNLRTYLEELAEEKAREHERVWEQNSPVAREIALNLKGVTQKECEFRYKAWLKVTEFMGAYEGQNPLSLLEEHNPIIYADRSIDPNDEQSLVNWFGWWSTLRLDQFRYFHVIGSSIKIKKRGSERASRYIKIPKYAPHTKADPDDVLSLIDKQYSPGEAVPADSSSLIGEDRVHDADEQLYRTQVFRSKMFNNDEHQTITNFLMARGQPKTWRAYGFPVFWKDSDEAYNFGDIHARGRTVQDWWSWPWSFMVPDRYFQVYLGFFYTVVEGWDPRKAPRGQKAKRQPWIGVYRPVLYFKPSMTKPHYTTTEVVIWDPAAKDRVRATHPLREEDLLPAQQEVIRHARKHTGEKNEGTVLTDVWLGGFEYSGDYEADIDITADYFARICNDLKDNMPAREGDLARSGFRRVTTIGNSDTPTVPTVDADQMGFEEKAGDINDPDTRIIFHPPRSTGGFRGRSKCQNHLYENVRLQHILDTKSEIMRYDFRPTLDWYEEQIREGRGYEHINVNTWEVIFNTFKIGSGEEANKDVAGKQRV